MIIANRSASEWATLGMTSFQTWTGSSPSPPGGQARLAKEAVPLQDARRHPARFAPRLLGKIGSDRAFYDDSQGLQVGRNRAAVEHPLQLTPQLLTPDGNRSFPCLPLTAGGLSLGIEGFFWLRTSLSRGAAGKDDSGRGTSPKGTLVCLIFSKLIVCILLRISYLRCSCNQRHGCISASFAIPISVWQMLFI